jgi:N utilization substance protein B
VGDAAERSSTRRVVAERGQAPHRDIPSRKGSRSKARKRALDILFESEARAEDPLDVLRRRIAGSDAPPVSDFAQTLVEGVVAHREHIDASLGEMARGWSVERMAAVDRAILRIGAYEVLFTDDVDDAVAIDEAILLARELSTDDSPRFVNGVLAGLASGRREPVAAPERERVDVPPDAELAAPEADGADARPHGADAEDTDG